MWLLVLMYIFVNLKTYSCTTLSPDIRLLKEFMIEGLRVDPAVQDEMQKPLSDEPKRFIDDKLDTFVRLVSRTQDEPRVKRSLRSDVNESDLAAINLFPEGGLPANLEDVRLFTFRNETYAAVLENGGRLLVYKHKETFYQKHFESDKKYSTNIAALHLKNLNLLVLGDSHFVTVFEYNVPQNSLIPLQTIETFEPKHVVLWEQDNFAFLSITQSSGVQIYQWLGRHFDHVQEVALPSVKKVIPFSIHGSYYLATVNIEQHTDHLVYSEILRYDHQHNSFKIFQKLPTNGGSDIKYFTSRLHGENQHFLVVVHSHSKITNSQPGTGNSSGSKNYVSVIYKYENRYFIPFQIVRTGAVLWQPIQDFSNAALIALTDEGIEGFQYDGWHFSKSDVYFNGVRVNAPGAKGLHTFNLNGKDLLVIICDKCDQTTNIFSFNFTTPNVLKETHSQLLSWCENTLSALQPMNNFMVGEVFRGDLNEEVLSLDEEPTMPSSAARTQTNFSLIQLEEAVQQLESLVSGLDINAKEVVFNDTLISNALNTTSLNENLIDDLLDNVLNLDEGFDLDGDLIEFNDIEVDSILVSKLNNRSFNDYVPLSGDIVLENLTILYPTIVKGGLNVDTNINNGIRISEDAVLLSEGDQFFEGNLTASELIVERLTANVTPQEDKFLKEISYIKHLKLKELKIGGLMNRVYIPMLADKALKKTGNQVLEQPLKADSVVVDFLNLEGTLSGKRLPHDFVLTNTNQTVTVSQNVKFPNELYIENLWIEHSLNSYAVNEDGELPFLLTHSPEMQYLKSNKSFVDLHMNKLIFRQNKINEENFKPFNPLVMENENYELEGDVTINGHVQLEDFIKAKNFVSLDNISRTLSDILDRGLKLSDEKIYFHLNFSEPLILDRLGVEKINGIDPRDWLQISADSIQIITGEKIFVDDLYIEGVVNVSKINEINLQEFEKQVLTTSGNQDLLGCWEVEKMEALNGIFSNNTDYTDSHNGLLVKGNLTTESLNVTTLNVNGTINGQNLTKIINNFVKPENSAFRAYGVKHFKELHVDNLIVSPDDNSQIVSLLKDVLEDHITINGSLELFNNISIAHLKFAENLNNISAQDFDSLVSLGGAPEEDVFVMPDMIYEEVVVLGDVTIGDDHINRKNLTSIYKDSVKIDEDHWFNNATVLQNIFIETDLNLKGNIENLDLDNIVLSNASNSIFIENKIFKDKLNIEGALSIHNKVSGVDFDKLCSTMSSKYLKNLKIEGNVVFGKGPKVRHFNDITVRDLKNSLWFVDQTVHLPEDLRVNNATFNAPVYVKEYVDAIKLDLLAKNYFSKSKPQVIPARYSFQNLSFTDVTTPLLTTETLNGIVIDDLPKLVLLQNVSQLFENPVYFAEVQVRDLNADVLVNGLNLQHDVMCYDKPNMVTGPKNITDLNVEDLKLLHKVNVQGVDVISWLENAILRTGTFRINGKKSFKAASFKGYLSLRGKLNDHQEFNQSTVMLTNIPQNITGKKTFIQPVKFFNLWLKGLVNGVDINDLIDDQVYKEENSVLNSEVMFLGNVSVDNLIVDSSYNNTNLTRLMYNLTKLRNLDDLEAKFKSLLDLGMVLDHTPQEERSLFKYYKEVMKIESSYDIFGLRCKDHAFRVLSFSNENETNVFKTFEWSSQANSFILAGENIELEFKPEFLHQMTIGDEDYLYLEQLDPRSGPPGRLVQLQSPSSFKTVGAFYHNGTNCLTSFVHPATKKPCLGFVNYASVDVCCVDADLDNFRLVQRIDLPGVFKAVALEIFQLVYLFTAQRDLASGGYRVVVLNATKETAELPIFSTAQILFESELLNDISVGVIDGLPYLALSFESEESPLESGWISIYRLDKTTNQFVRWQYIPVGHPQGVHLVTSNSMEPLLLVPTYQETAPLNIFRYEGVARFQRTLKGSALPITSKVRVMANGHFLGLVDKNKKMSRVLEAVVDF